MLEQSSETVLSRAVRVREGVGYNGDSRAEVHHSNIPHRPLPLLPGDVKGETDVEGHVPPVYRRPLAGHPGEGARGRLLQGVGGPENSEVGTELLSRDIEAKGAGAGRVKVSNPPVSSGLTWSYTEGSVVRGYRVAGAGVPHMNPHWPDLGPHRHIASLRVSRPVKPRNIGHRHQLQRGSVPVLNTLHFRPLASISLPQNTVSRENLRYPGVHRGDNF